VRGLKNCDKAADRSDQQASLTLAAVGFFSFATKKRLARLKKTKELP